MAFAKADQFDGPYTARANDPTDETIPGLIGPGPTPRDRLLVALRDQGMSYRAMATALGLSSVTGLRVAVSLARKKLRAVGATFQIAADRLDQEIVPLAVARLHGMVQAGVPEAVFRTLQGRGLLRDHRAGGEAPPAQLPNLSITFQQVTNSPSVAAGSIVGAPRVALQAAPALPLELPAMAEPVAVPRGTSALVQAMQEAQRAAVPARRE